MNRLSALIKKYPITRGCILYSVLWPTSDLCRQLSTRSQDGKISIDTQRLVRFSLFGSLWVAPSVFFWVKLSGKLISGTTFKVAMLKAVIEQFTYGPFSITTFYFGMSLLEGNSFKNACQEVQNKFFKTWKTGITFWPFVQTINFAFIPEKNRVIVVGIASFCWTTYLSFMKTTPS